MFFIRLDEWGWDEAPPRVPMFPGDLPRQDHPLPKALDDASAAKLLRAAQNDKRLLVRVTVEMLLRTGLRVSEYTSLRADAVVQIGAGPVAARPGRQAPRGPLPAAAPAPGRPDRRLPHPHVDPANPLLLPRENGKPADRHAVTRYINKAGAAAGLPHIHPHQLRHTLATQAINRGMSLEAIAAMLGHRSLDMTLRYAKIASRTVADEYFAVTEQGRGPLRPGPRAARRRDRPEDGPAAPRAPPDARQRLVHPARPSWTARSSRSAKPAPSSRPASSSAPPCKPSTTTPSPSTKTTAGSCSPRCSPASTRTPHEPPAPAPGPPRPAARARHRRRQPPVLNEAIDQPRPAAHRPTGSATPPSGCTPWPASSPRPNSSCPRPSTTPATRNSPGPRSASSSTPPPPPRHAATGTSHDQLDKDHRHNADERTLHGLITLHLIAYSLLY